MTAASRIPSMLAPGVLALVAGSALVLAGVPAERGALGVLVVALLVAGITWAVVGLEQFVLVGVLGAMILPVALVQPAGAQVALVDVLFMVALAAWLVRASLGAGPAPSMTGNPLLVPALLFAAVTAASLAWSVAPAETAKSIVQTVEIVVLVPLLFASVPGSLRTIRTGLLLYVVLTCLLAVITFALFLPRAAAGDVTGQYLPGLHKNAIGSFVAGGLVLAYGLWLAEHRGRVRWALAAAALVELVGLVATNSRGSIGGAAVAVLAVSALLRRRRVLTVALVAMSTAVFLATIGTTAGPDPRQTGGYESAAVRGYSFVNAIEKIAERPLLGTGAGTYEDYIPELDIGLRDPNNLFLLTWAEVGIVGLAALAFLLYRFGRALVGARRLPPEAATAAVVAGGVVLSLLVHFQVDSTWNRGTATLAFAMTGVVVAARRLAHSHFDEAAGDDRRDERDEEAARATVLAVRDGNQPGDVSEEPATEARTIVTTDGVDAAEPLRVLHVLTSDAYAGIERHVVRLAHELRRQGCAAELACPQSATRLRAEAAAAAIPVHPSDPGRPRAWLGVVAREIAERPPDILHLHDGRAAVAGILLASVGDALVVRTQHFTRPASVERSGWRRDTSLGLHRALNRRLHGYVAVSQSVADAARERREIDDARIGVIAPGIALPAEDVLLRAKDARERFDHPIVAYVGRLEREKRVDLLLEAIPRVLERLPDCRFVVAGAGAAERSLRLLADRLGIEDAVTWTGEVADPGAVFESAHLYVNPSPAEGFGLATAEAMSFGLPVVAIASGGSAELVADGTTGILVPEAEPAAIAAAIVRLAGDRSRAAQMGAAARRSAERYGADRTARETLAFYRRLREARV